MVTQNPNMEHHIQGGGKFRDGNISLWEISYFKCVRNFPLNFQATVRNKPGAKFSIVWNHLKCEKD